MARLRSIVTLPWTSGLAEDVTVNTFHFLTTSSPATATELDQIDTSLQAVWNFSSGVANDELRGYIGDLVSRVADACTIDHYDLDDPEPRVPIRTTTWTLGAADSASTAPPEVALCLSFQANPSSGIPQARRRGRVYLGPWNTNVLSSTGRPTSGLQNAVAAAGNFLHDTLQGAVPVRWCVYSRVGDAMAEVTNGWCDNEWDTQRSRGRKATSRVTFS